MANSAKERCFCGSQRPFSRCCGPHLAALSAPTAEALMRSRYSAFCQGNIDYLMATHHPSKRADDDATRLASSVRNTAWQNLLIVKTQKGQKKDKTGVVEFVAAYQHKTSTVTRLLNVAAGQSEDLGIQPSSLQASSTQVQASSTQSSMTHQLHERSRFIREKGQWFYLEGDILSPFQPKRPSSSCWCGSGRPFKHCHA